MTTARDLMNPTPVSVGPQLGVFALLQMLFDVSADAACVVEGDTLIGVVTSREIGRRPELARELLQRQRPDVRVRAVMTDVPPATPQTSAEAVLEQLYEPDTPGCVPIVEGGRLVGLVTRKSAIAAFVGQPPGTPVIK